MILRSFTLYLAVPVISGAVNLFFLVPITTYYLGPAEFGVIALLSTVIAFFLPLAVIGSNWALSAYYLSSHGDERREMMFNLLMLEFSLRLLLVLTLWFSADGVLSWVIAETTPLHRELFGIILLGSLANALWPTVSYVLILEKRASLFSGLEMLRLAVVASATWFIAKWVDAKYLMLVVPNTVASVAVAIPLLPLLVSRVRVRFSLEWLGRILRMGLPALPGNYADSVVNSLDKIFISRMLGVSEVGYYAHSRAYQAISSMAGKAFTQSANPLLLEAYANNQPLDSLVAMIRTWFLILSLGGIAFSLVIEDLITILTHGKFVAAAPLTVAWYLFSAFQVYGVPFTQYLVARRCSLLIMKIQLFSSLMTVLFLALGVYLAGLIGGTVGMVFGTLINQWLRRIFAVRLGCTLEPGSVLLWVSAATVGAYLMSVSLAMPQTLRITLSAVALVVAIRLAIKRWMV